MKGTKNLENLDAFVSFNTLEDDDTIDCFQDYNSLQTSEESIAHFVTQKEVLVIEQSGDEWEYDGATDIFEILDDEVNDEVLKCTHCFSVNNNNEIR